MALLVPELRARYRQDDDLAALVTKAAAVSARTGRLPRVREATLPQLRVHTAQVPVSYVQRDAQPDVVEAVGRGRAVLVVGHSMAGKTRLAAEVIRSRYPGHPLLVAESGKALNALMAGKWNPAEVVVWLDYLERFLGADGLTIGVLHALSGGAALLLARRGESAEAEVWWRLAAEAGHSNAMHNLGVLFEQRGEAAEAEARYRRAAESRS